MNSIEPQKKSEGKIIKVQHEKGFGFIISQEHKFVKFFFHWTGLTQSVEWKDLKEGMKVRFIPIISLDEDKKKGPKAISIELIEK